MFQSVSPGMNQIWSAAGMNPLNLAAGMNPLNLATRLGSEFPIQSNPPMEVVYHLNNNTDWTNINMWGTPFLPLNASAGIMIGGHNYNYNNAEQISMMSLEAKNSMADGSPQLSKGKEIVQEVMEKNGRKSAGRGKGKQKIIATGHKATPKAKWLKRGEAATEEEQKAAKKQKKIRMKVRRLTKTSRLS